MSDRRRFSGFVSQILGRFSQARRYPDQNNRFPQASYAGVRVTADSALKNSTCWAATRYISQTVGGLPWQVRFPRLDGKGSETASAINPIQYLIGVRPNPEISSFQFRETLTHWALRRGNGYAEIERDGAGRPIALWPLQPDNTEPRRDAAGNLFYRYTQPDLGGTIDFDARDIFHIRGFGDDVVGLNVMEYAAQSIGWAQATEIFGSTFFGEGMNPSMIISTIKTLSPPAKDELRKELNSIHRGPRKGGRFAIIDQGMKAEPVTRSAEDSQFIDTRQHQIEEMCRWFGVPPHKVAHLLRAHFNNVEHQSIEAVTDTIYPWAKRFQDEADYKLFGAQNRRGFYTVMNLKGLLRGDSQARAQYFQIRRNIGSISANEVRELEDENPIPTEGGDMYVMQGQYQSLEAIAATSQRTVDGPPEPVEPPRQPMPEEADMDQRTARLRAMIGG